MKRVRWLSILMIVTTLGVAGFLAYWLRQNYVREEKSLSIRSDITFRETIENLQVLDLRLDGMPFDSTNKSNVKILRDNIEGDGTGVPRRELVSTINIMRERLNDSVKHFKGKNKDVFIATNHLKFSTPGDSSIFIREVPNPRKDHIIRVLYGVDSLMDSVKIKDFNRAYDSALHNEGLNVPFTISRLDSSMEDEQGFNRVTIGLVHPVTYRLELGNTVPYLLKKIGLPILFSILLLGITIICFLLVYKTLMRQQKLAEMKNEFISNITHELKTPIATVGVAIEALKNFNAMQDPQRTKEYLDISSNELQRLGLLVDKVLKLSMFEKHEVDLKYEIVDMKALVEEVAASMRLQLEKNHAKIGVHSSGNPELEGDKLHLQSVIYNLIDNAIKYGKSNPVIDIVIERLERELQLTVTDNGIGIPAEYKEKIFEKFFRIPHGNTHDAKGYGLGLSYAAHVIRKHHGTISLESQPGIGTKFIIRLPVKAESNS